MSAKRTGIAKKKQRLNLDALPPITAEQQQQLAALRNRAVDYSDLPSQKGKSWTRPGALVPVENKKQITLRLDADVLKFFKTTGRRYQSRINAVLREYMADQKKVS